MYHKLFEKKLFNLHTAVFNRFIKGVSKRELDDLAKQFITDSIDQILYMPTVQRLKRAQHLGSYTLILSASPEFLVEPLARYLHVDEFYGTSYIEEDGLYTQMKTVLDGAQKEKILKELLKERGLSRLDVTTFSDSYLDLTFLQVSAKPVVVSPDKKLKSLSLKNGWEII